MTPLPPRRWAGPLCALALCVLGIAPHAGLAEAVEPTLRTPRPVRWLPSRGRECTHAGRYRHMCEGPRRAPAPYGPAEDRALMLDLGTRAAAGRLLVRGPDADWIAAAGGRRTKTLLWPVPEGRLGRGFGYVRKHMPGTLHKGIDIQAEEGTLVRAVNDGLVAYSDNGIRGYGNTVLLVHRDGTTSLYAHQRANYVFAGQRVKRGQVIGEIGLTGLTWGPHLHFEWRRANGRPRNPLPRMVGRPGPSRDRAEALQRM